MVDCSNPIVDHSRVKASMLREVRAIRLRQDLPSLTNLCRGAARALLSVEERYGWQAKAAEDLKETVKLLQTLQVEAGSFDPRKTPLVSVGKCPVSRLTYEGELVHPKGVNQKNSCAHTLRLLGGGKRECLEVPAFLRVFEPSEFTPATELIYTRGTADGFATRIEKQVSRKCVDIRHRPQGHSPRNVTEAYLQQVLRKILPYREDSLPDWEGDTLMDLLDDIDVTARASAGAPYWRDKCEVHEIMMGTVMPKLVQALLDNKVEDLQREEPELFLCEMKNKLDRYEVEKLGQKCRPYFAIPYHWSALFSVLSQNFSEALMLFYESEHCANAYGLAWAGGGAEKMREWASKTTYKNPRFYCYGDDTDFYWRDREGVLWRASPDFTQMDGSVDSTCIRAAIDYVYLAFAKKYGESPFWKRVCDWWFKFATNPEFLVSGDEVYRKPQVDGLATGVVGTTYFDTVKAVVSYEWFADLIRFGTVPEKGLHVPELVTNIFLEMGLEIKKGTWKPVRVNETVEMGELFADSKFLGVYLKYVPGPKCHQLVPYLPQEDWIKLICNPRDLQEGKEKRTEESYLSRQRTAFDRMRGYLITGAFSNDRVRSAIHAQLNTIDAVAINMEVRAGMGKGALPDNTLILGKDFQYHDSEGVPSEKWCQNLYFTEDNQWEESEASWIYLFPTIKEQLSDFKEKVKRDNPLLVSEVRNLSLICQDPTFQLPPISSGPTQRQKVKRGKTPLLPSFKQGDVSRGEAPGPEGQQLQAFFKNRSQDVCFGDMDLIGVSAFEVKNHFNWTFQRLFQVVQEAGYFWEGDWICSDYIPMGIPAPRLQAQVEVALADSSNKFSKFSEGETKILEALPLTEPKEMIGVKILCEYYEGASEFMEGLGSLLSKSNTPIALETLKPDLEVLRLSWPNGRRYRMKISSHNQQKTHTEGQKEIVYNETNYKVSFIDLDREDEGVAFEQWLFRMTSPLRSINSARASVLLFETLQSAFLVEKPLRSRQEGTKSERLAKTYKEVLASGKPTFTVGPTKEAPPVQNWFESVEREQNFERFKISVIEAECPPGILEKTLDLVEPGLLEKYGKDIYPLDVKILKGTVTVAPFGAPRIKTPAALRQPPLIQSQQQHGSKEKVSRNRRSDGTRKRSSGDTGPKRAKKWKANKKKRKEGCEEQQLYHDFQARGCPRVSRDAVTQQASKKSEAEGRRPAPLHRGRVEVWGKGYSGLPPFRSSTASPTGC